MLKKGKIPVLITIIMLGTILSPTFIHTSHAASGEVCLADPSAQASAPCPANPPGFAGPVGQLIRIGVWISGSNGFNAIDVTLLGNHTWLKPFDADLTGSVLTGTANPGAPPVVVLLCLGGKLIAGTVCSSPDTVDTIHVSAVRAVGESLTPTPTTGLLFTAIFNVTGTTPAGGVRTGFQVGCGSQTSVAGGVCVTVAAGTVTPAETVQGGTFDSSTSASMAQIVLSASPMSFGPEFPTVSNTATVTATAKNGFPGFSTDSVLFTTTKSSPSVTATITGTNPCATTGTSCSVTVSIVASSAGDYVVTVFGTYSTLDSSNNPDTLVSAVSINVVVDDFGLTLKSTSLSLTSGSTGTDGITLTSLNGFAGTFSLSTGIAVPSGLTITYNPASVTLVAGRQSNSTATFSASPPSLTTYHASIKATLGTRVKTSPTITVSVMPNISDFNVTANPNTIAVAPQATGVSTISVTALNGFKGTVTLTASVSPSGGLTCSLTPTVINTTGTSSLRCASPASGTFTVTIAGTNGTIVHSTIVVFSILSAADFSISANPGVVTVREGSTGASTITITATGGFIGNVTLNPLVPSGLSCSLSQVVISITEASTLSCIGSAGSYIVVVTGTLGSLTHSVSILFNVTPSTTMGVVCIARDGSTSCPISPALINSSLPPAQVRVAVVVNSSLALNAFDITLFADHTILKPAGVDLTGTVLPGRLSVLVECLGGRLVSGTTCSSTDTIDTLHLAAGSQGLSFPPTTGLLFTAIYNVTGASSGMIIGFQTGCSHTSVSGGVCVTISNGSTVPDQENVQTALFASMPTFSLQPLPTSTLRIPQGSSDSSLFLNITSINNFAGTVTLTSLFIPPGPTVTLSPTSVKVNTTNPSNLQQFSQVKVTVATSVPAGNYILIINATSGTISRSLAILVIVEAPDFTITISPQSLTFDIGLSATGTVTVASLAGFKGTLMLATSLSPLASSLQFSTLSLNPNGTNSSIITISSTSSTQAGTHTISIRGSSGSISHTARLAVNIADFTLSIHNQSMSLSPGVGGATSIEIHSLNLTGIVSTSASAPTGLTASFGFATVVVVSLVPGSDFAFSITITPSPTIPAGVYTVNVTAVGPTSVHTGKILVTITIPPLDFSITSQPGFLVIQQGGTGNATVTVKGISQFKGNVTLTATTPTNGPTVTLVPSTISISNSVTTSTSTLQVTAIIPGTSLRTPAGIYNITITGASGTIVHTLTLVISVISPPPPDFAITASTSFLVAQAGSTWSITLTVTSFAGFRGNVTLSSTTLPVTVNAPIVSLRPAQVTLLPGGSSTSQMVITTLSSTPRITYTISVAGTNGTINRSFNLVLQVVAPPDVPPVANFSFTPSSPTVGQIVNFDATSSFDPDGIVVLWTWNFGDNSGIYTSSSPFINHSFFNGGNFTVSLTVQDNAGLTGGISKTVSVRAQPPHDVRIVEIFAAPTTAVSTQVVVIQSELTNDGTNDENVALTVYINGHSIKTVDGIFLQACSRFGGFCFTYVQVIWDTAGVLPGNYTVSATVFLHAGETDPTPLDNSVTGGIITVLPPPALVTTPTSGSLGTKIVVQGSGFPHSGFSFGPSSALVEVSFDDMNLGFVLTSTGTFNFTFDLPPAQPGPHIIKAIDEYSSAHTSVGFQSLPSPGSLVVTMSTGTVYFPGDTATIYVLTSLNGTRVGSNGLHLQVLLVSSNGAISNLTIAPTSPGLYKATYPIPKNRSLGTYFLVAKASMVGAANGAALSGFEVKPSWFSSQGPTVAGGTAVAGVLGFAAFAWHKGYFKRKDQDDLPQPRDHHGEEN